MTQQSLLTRDGVRLINDRLWHQQNGRYSADDIFARIFLNGNLCTSIKIPLNFVLMESMDKKPSLDYVMAWRLFGANPLPESTMTQATTA